MSLVIDKALRLIDSVEAGQETLGALVAASGLTRSTTHRLLSALVARGYLAYGQRRYQLGYRLLELGEKKRRSLGFLNDLQPILQRYAELTLDTIHVAMLDGTDIVLIERIAGRRPLQIRSFVGQRAPAYATAVGKALIGRRPPETWDSYCRGVPQDYPKSVALIRHDFEEARRRNVGIDYDEVSVGTCGVASTFLVSDGLHAAVSINGATVYFDKERLESVSEIVRSAATDISDVFVQRRSRPGRAGPPA